MTTPAHGRLTIRPADVRDAGTLGAIRRTLFDEVDRPRWDAQASLAFTNASIAAFDRGLREGWCHAWLAEDGRGEAVGATALLVFPRLPSPASLLLNEGYLLNVYTGPAWRGRRVARDLVSAAVAHARALHLARIRLHTTTDGRRVYAPLGFSTRDNEMELWLS